MKKNSLNVRLSCTIIAGVALTCLCFSPVAKAAGPSSGTTMPMDQMLDYSLADLKTHLQTVVDENSKLVEKNNALRKRTMTFRQELRNLENQKIGLLEEAVELSDKIKLNAKEIAIDQRKIENAGRGGANLQEEQDRLQKQISAAADEGRTLQQEISDLAAEVAQVRQDYLKSSSVKVKQDFDRKRYNYLSLINETQSRLQQGQKEISGLERRLADWERQKADTDRIRDVLRDDLSAVQSEWDARLDDEKTIKSDQQAMTTKVSADQQKINDANMQLKLYARELEGAINQLREANRLIAAQSEQHTVTMNRMIELLKREGQLLADRGKFLKATVSAYQDIKSQQAKRKAALTQTGSTKQERLKGLQDEITAWESKVSTAQAANDEQQKAAKRNSDEIVSLKSKLKNVSRPSLNQKPVRRSAELTRLQTRAEAAKRQADQSGNNLQQSQAALTDLKVQQAKLKELLSVTKRQAEELASVPAVIAPVADSGAIDQQAVDEIEAQIEALKMRDAVLSSSLTVIKSKYDSDDMAVREFQEDEQQLGDYLQVLKDENFSLQEKISSTTKILDELKYQQEDYLDLDDDIMDTDKDSEPQDAPLEKSRGK